MIELRQRPISRGVGYQRVNTEDDFDEIPQLRQSIKIALTEKSSTCNFTLFQYCFIAYFIFIGAKSPYIKIKQDSVSNVVISDGIFGAIMMYCVCVVLSLIYWYNSASARNFDRRFDD
jgi:uncharacterized membrane protein (DUF485 family)